MSSVAVIANTQKITKKDARTLRRSLVAAGVGDVCWLEIKKGSDAKRAAARAIKASGY